MNFGDAVKLAQALSDHKSGDDGVIFLPGVQPVQETPFNIDYVVPIQRGAIFDSRRDWQVAMDIASDHKAEVELKNDMMVCR